MKKRTVNIFSLLWVLIGVMIFFVGWCQWYIYIPLIGMILLVVRQLYCNEKGSEKLAIGGRQFLIAILISVFVMFLCGIGGFVVQPLDHQWRNAIFRDLVNYSWPVYNSSDFTYMCYYVTFWMVPAMLAKITNSINLGFFFQLVWASIGMFLLFLQVCLYIGKVRLSTFFFIVLFGSLQVFVAFFFFLFFDGPYKNTPFLLQIYNLVLDNIAIHGFLACPNMQSFHDPFNQTIPFFLLLMLIINNLRSKYIPFYYAISLMYAPFPFLAITPVVGFLFINNLRMTTMLPDLFSLSNITAIVIIVLLILYMSSNISSGSYGLIDISNTYEQFYAFILYVVFGFGIYLYIGYEECQNKTLLWILFVTTCIMSWCRIGYGNDICFRGNMPLIWISCLLIMRKFYSTLVSKKIKIVILCCLIFSSISAMGGTSMRIGKTLYLLDFPFVNRFQIFASSNSVLSIRDNSISSVMTRDDVNNFKGRSDTFFYKYIAKAPLQEGM